ncbi:acyl carrier protein [Sorangium sp. So ce1151]|uniref:acyl carrier protein n=1 Tax=Sorangium sp. So ce1151 TaxID=3133332 RepID=UPI003F635B73
MSTQDNKSKIGSYLARYFPGHELREEEDIFALGFVNSMFAMQLVNYVEHEFGVVVENEDLELDNFRSIRALDAFVARKLKTATAAA